MSGMKNQLTVQRNLSGANARLIIGTTLILTLMFAGAALAASVQVDNFNSGNLGVLLGAPGIPEGGVESAIGAALGDERDIIALHENGTGFVTMAVNFAGSEYLEYTSGSGITGRGIVIWDGVDGDAFDNAQLLNEDIDDGTNDGFHIEVIDNDLPIRIIIRVYSSDTAWSEGSLVTPGGIDFPNHVDFFLPFDNFSQGAGANAQANFLAVSSIEFEIDGTVTSSADISLDFLDIDNFRDYGDIPSSYGAATDASHIASGLRLGAQLDIEASKPVSPPPGATADDILEVDDEDGVRLTPGFNWDAGADGGRVDFTVRGCASAPCYVNAWMDTGQDNSFDPGEELLVDFPVGNADYSAVPVDVPASTSFGASYYVRFRICENPGDCNSPVIADVSSGEVEDYQWSFGPTAVTLSSLGARPVPATSSTNLLVASLVLILVSSLLVLRFSRQSAAVQQ